MSVNFYDSTTNTLTRLDGLASEANLVHKSGTETVTGEKTFSGDVVATRIESTGTVTIGKRYNESESAETGGNLAVEGEVLSTTYKLKPGTYSLGWVIGFGRINENGSYAVVQFPFCVDVNKTTFNITDLNVHAASGSYGLSDFDMTGMLKYAALCSTQLAFQFNTRPTSLGNTCITGRIYGTMTVTE